MNSRIPTVFLTAKTRSDGGALVAGIPFALLTAYYAQLSGGAITSRAARRRAARRG
jgi:hypothetical protein